MLTSAAKKQTAAPDLQSSFPLKTPRIGVSKTQAGWCTLSPAFYNQTRISNQSPKILIKFPMSADRHENKKKSAMEHAPGLALRSGRGAKNRTFPLITPQDAGWFFGDNFRSALFTWPKRRRRLQTNHTKPPPAGFGGAVRRSRAITKKGAFLCVFLRAAKNTKITPFSLIPKVFGHV